MQENIFISDTNDKILIEKMNCLGKKIQTQNNSIWKVKRLYFIIMTIRAIPFGKAFSVWIFPSSLKDTAGTRTKAI